MKSDILNSFHKALAYNSVSVLAYKILFITLSYLLFMHFSAEDYLQWGNTMALVYLTVLWADLGLKKSIAQFAPYLFEGHAHFLRRFIPLYILILLAAGLLLITIVPLALTTKILVLLLVITEGSVSLLRSLFHAKFENKFFNIAYIIFFAVEVAIIILMLTGHVSFTNIRSLVLSLTDSLLVLRICNSLLVISFTAPKLLRLLKQQNKQIQTNNFPLKEFITHCSVLSITTVARSITERNMLLPIIITLFGPILAAPCKLAQDVAIVFQRFLFKTLATNDTAFLSILAKQNKAESNEKTYSHDGFYHVAYRVIKLCIPILLVISIASLLIYRFQDLQTTLFTQDAYTRSQAFYYFLIFIIFFMLESLLVPYERFLEVNQAYKSLLFSYTPYTLAFGIIYYMGNTTNLGIFLIATQSIRLAVGIFHAGITHYLYRVKFPFKILAIGLVCCIVINIVFYIMLFYII